MWNVAQRSSIFNWNNKFLTTKLLRVLDMPVSHDPVEGLQIPPSQSILLYLYPLNPNKYHTTSSRFLAATAKFPFSSVYFRLS